MEAFADALADDNQISFFKMEIASNRQLLIDLNVSGLPAFLFFKNGQKASLLGGRNISIDEIKDHCQGLLI